MQDSPISAKHVPISLAVIAVAALTLSACSQSVEAMPTPKTPPTPELVRWGASELTHANFTTSMADEPCPAQSDSVIYIDPLPYIVSRAKDHKIVMINESHSKPLHRVFIAELAAALREDGFDRYGAEAFASPGYPDNRLNPAMMERGYPVTTDGTYLREPVYGQSIERIIDLGYTTFAYENKTEPPPTAMSGIDHRDSQQANNILADMANHPRSKYIIHAGYEHIRENEDDGYAATWMARFFAQKSGIDPLTVNQTDCYGTGVFEGGTLGYAMPVDTSGEPITYPGFDILIIPPVEAQYRERPLWLHDALARQFVDVPKVLQFDDDFTRITAFNTARIDDATAEDTIYRTPHSDKPLALRSGNYRIEVRGKDKRLRAEAVIEVPSP